MGGPGTGKPDRPKHTICRGRAPPKNTRYSGFQGLLGVSCPRSQVGLVCGCCTGTRMAPKKSLRALRSAVPQVARRMAGFNAEAPRVAETRRVFIFSAFLSVSALSPVRLWRVAGRERALRVAVVRPGRQWRVMKPMAWSGVHSPLTDFAERLSLRPAMRFSYVCMIGSHPTTRSTGGLKTEYRRA